MAKVIAIIDSNTGNLVDVAGNSREGARYRKFAGRMMSIGSNPVVLDYGANGGTKLEVSQGGYAGEEIVLKANTVKVSGKTFMVNGKKLEDIIASGGETSIFDDIKGGDGISVSQEQDSEDPEKTVLVIALSEEVSSDLEQIRQAISDMEVGNFISKEDLAGVIRGVEFGDGDTLESVKSKLKVMVDRLSDLVGTD